MVNQTKLAKIAKTWQRIAALKRKRISFPKMISKSKNEGSRKSGNFVIYTDDVKRFVIPIAYIGNIIIKELLKMSEEEFGLPNEGPIKLPCDAAFLEYVVTIIKRGLPKDIEKALLMSMESTCNCSFHVGFHQQ